MKKYSKLKVLNQQIEDTPDLNEKQEVVTAVLNEGLSGCIKEATILTIFENYGIFLISEKDKAVVDAVAEIEKIISVVYERGDVNVSALKHVKEYLDNYRVDTKLRLQEKMQNDFFDHVLVEEMGEVIQTTNTKIESCCEFMELARMERKLNMAKHNLIAKYKKYVEKDRDDFIMSYQKMFDPEFIERFTD